MKTVQIIVVLVLFVFVGCKAPEKISCAVNADCMSSCSQGAVNRLWYQSHFNTAKECKDGCSGVGHDARCVSGVCVSIFQGKVDRVCSGR